MGKILQMKDANIDEAMTFAFRAGRVQLKPKNAAEIEAENFVFSEVEQFLGCTLSPRERFLISLDRQMTRDPMFLIEATNWRHSFKNRWAETEER